MWANYPGNNNKSIGDRDVQCPVAVENSIMAPQKLKHRITCHPAIPLLGIYPNEWKVETQILFFNPHPRICLLILEREEGGREREKHWCERETSVASHTDPLNRSNPPPIGVWDDAPTNWITWPRQETQILWKMSLCPCKGDQDQVPRNSDKEKITKGTEGIYYLEEKAEKHVSCPWKGSPVAEAVHLFNLLRVTLRTEPGSMGEMISREINFSTGKESLNN